MSITRKRNGQPREHRRNPARRDSRNSLSETTPLPPIQHNQETPRRNSKSNQHSPGPSTSQINQHQVLPPIKNKTKSSNNNKSEDEPPREKVTRPRDDRQFDPDVGVGVEVVRNSRDKEKKKKSRSRSSEKMRSRSKSPKNVVFTKESPRQRSRSPEHRKSRSRSRVHDSKIIVIDKRVTKSRSTSYSESTSRDRKKDLVIIVKGGSQSDRSERSSSRDHSRKRGRRKRRSRKHRPHKRHNHRKLSPSESGSSSYDSENSESPVRRREKRPRKKNIIRWDMTLPRPPSPRTAFEMGVALSRYTPRDMPHSDWPPPTPSGDYPNTYYQPAATAYPGRMSMFENRNTEEEMNGVIDKLDKLADFNLNSIMGKSNHMGQPIIDDRTNAYLGDTYQRKIDNFLHNDNMH